ncbi:MAG: hypothetical protein AAFQ52_01960 [Chloroflexota bacterium]
MSEASAPASPPPPERRSFGKRIRDLVFGTTMVDYIVRVTLIPLAFYIAFFVVGLYRAWVDPVGSANYFEYIRGLFETILSVAMTLIIIAIGVLVIQIARFINLLRSEIKPITEDTKQAIKNVRVTTEFVQKNAVKPIIKGQSFLAGLIAFLREISRISSILRRTRPSNTSASSASTANTKETPADE